MRNPYAVYRQEQVQGASRPELVLMLFNEARRRVRAAAAALRDGRREAARGDLRRAGEIVAALHEALDERTGELAARLAQLYAYVESELLQASLHDDPGRLEGPLAVLDTLADAWRGAMERTAAAAPSAG